MSLMLKIFAPLLAIFGAGGPKDISRFGFIPEGSIGIRMRFGKVIRDAEGKPILQKPGWNKRHIPFLDKGHHRSTMPQSHKLEAQDIQLSDQTFFVISSMASFKIVDIEKVIVGLNNFQDMLRLRCEATLLKVLSAKNSPDMNNIESINTQLLAAIKLFGQDLGVEFSDFSLIKYHPTHQTAELIQLDRIIEQRAKSLSQHTHLLAGTDAMGATILSGSALISTGSLDSSIASPAVTAAVIPLQSVPDPAG
jgi:hypothetical protein